MTEASRAGRGPGPLRSTGQVSPTGRRSDARQTTYPDAARRGNRCHATNASAIAPSTAISRCPLPKAPLTTEITPKSVRIASRRFRRFTRAPTGARAISRSPPLHVMSYVIAGGRMRRRVRTSSRCLSDRPTGARRNSCRVRRPLVVLGVPLRPRYSCRSPNYDCCVASSCLDGGVLATDRLNQVAGDAGKPGRSRRRAGNGCSERLDDRPLRVDRIGLLVNVSLPCLADVRLIGICAAGCRQPRQFVFGRTKSRSRPRVARRKHPRRRQGVSWTNRRPRRRRDRLHSTRCAIGPPRRRHEQLLAMRSRAGPE